MHSRNSVRLVGLLVLACAAVSWNAGPIAAAGPTAVDTAQIDVINVPERTRTLPEDLTFRARVNSLAEPGPVTIRWRYGGETQGGDVISGVLGENVKIGQWTDPVPLISLAKGRYPPRYHSRKWFLTFTFTVGGRGATKPVMDFEFSYQGKVLKTFTEAGPDGGTVGIVFPHYLLSQGHKLTDAAFLSELGGLLDYATRRAERLEKLPWAHWPLPKRYAVVEDLAGYGRDGYGVRHSNKAIVAAECRALRQLGANGLRGAPDYLIEMIYKGEGIGRQFARARISHAMGFPVPRYRKDRDENPAEAGCPYGTPVPKLTADGVASSLAHCLKIPVDEVWALTVDEIGTVMDRTPEGKGHMNVCPRCIEGYRAYLKTQGVTPADVGETSWEEVCPRYGIPGPPAAQYWSRKFNNYASAKMFTALKDAFDQANETKRQALARGETDTPAAKQPWIYSYALRGNTFLMKSHSLDFYDFYRHADNAFVYETSNRGTRIWSWDSYLCDVGRVVSARMNKVFGIYVKPHRGAPVQRALSAVSRGATMLYWYTYGPEYWKGDSFADRWDCLELASKGGHLIGKTEDVLYGSSWPAEPQVAIVKPRASEFHWGSNVADAAWENAKWVYTALAHAHVPVDPIDEVMLATDDLSRYKIIYVNGSYLPRSAAENVAKWVAAGGTLWTSGWGCARDEADRPLTALQSVLGVAERGEPELWRKIDRYGAGSIQSFSGRRDVLAPVPAGAKIVGRGKYESSFAPVVGREVLKPVAGVEILARYADGGVAAIRHKHGKGQAFLVGFYAGLEYSAPVRTARFNMARDFAADRRSFIAAPALELVQPVVDAAEPTVEGCLVRNDKTGRRAVTLMNWAYRIGAIRKYPDGRTSPVVKLVPREDLKVTIRLPAPAGAQAQPVSKVTSAMLEKDLPFRADGDAITVTLPRLDEGDVLLLD